MRIVKCLATLGLSALLTACGGGSGDSGKNPLPEDVTLSVSLPEDFNVHPGEVFSISAVGKVTPYHPDIELTYTWSKTVYPKPYDELLRDHGGSVESMLHALDDELDFYEGQTLEDVAPTLDDGAYVQYQVKISAEGYTADYASTGDEASLLPTSALGTDAISVTIVSE
jgi:hypothetical protein